MNGKEIISQQVFKTMEKHRVKLWKFIKTNPNNAIVTAYVLPRYQTSITKGKMVLSKRVRLIIATENPERFTHFDLDNTVHQNVFYLRCRNFVLAGLRNIGCSCDAEIKLLNHDLNMLFQQEYKEIQVTIINGGHQGDGCFFGRYEEFSSKDLGRNISQKVRKDPKIMKELINAEFQDKKHKWSGAATTVDRTHLKSKYDN